MSVTWTKKRTPILDTSMAYVDRGLGKPVVFLHGNPTSSWLWRNILPALEQGYRCLAPDLPGMGDSPALSNPGPGRYDFATHSRYLDAWFDKLELQQDVILVIHDWGSALGFDWARRHSDAVLGIAYMEAIVMPLTWQQWPESSRPVFKSLRSEAGDAMILEKNIFVERIFPASIQRKLDSAEMDEYRRPFLEAGEARRPTLDWPRQLPLDGEPGDVVKRVQTYADWMSVNDMPKLFVNAEPGAILVGEQREYCRRWKNQQEVTVPGIHFIQEDSPAQIASALLNWVNGL